MLIDVLPKELIAWIDLNVGPSGPGNLPWMTDNPMLPFAIRGASADEVLQAGAYWKRAGGLARAFGIAPGENGLVVNGRVSAVLSREKERG